MRKSVIFSLSLSRRLRGWCVSSGLVTNRIYRNGMANHVIIPIVFRLDGLLYIYIYSSTIIVVIIAPETRLDLLYKYIFVPIHAQRPKIGKKKKRKKCYEKTPPRRAGIIGGCPCRSCDALRGENHVYADRTEVARFWLKHF